jgi:hypothetical protein
VRDARRRLTASLCFVGLCGLVYAVAMEVRRGPELLDDGAFLLRYAENMLRGEFWVWNRGEAPVWGASAPLYPLLLALPLGLGVNPVMATAITGMILTALAFSLVAVALAHRFGLATGLAFVVFSALDSHVMYFAASGLESPLTFLLLGLAVWVLLGAAPAWALGLLAGLLAVHKVDLLPAAALLLVGGWVKDRRIPAKAAAVAVMVAGVWYSFAWIYFGTPLPNSFLTKIFHQDSLPKSIDWRWFGTFVLGAGLHPWLVALSAVAVAERRRSGWPLAVFLGGTLGIHLVAYTIKHPFEPYAWYAMPSVFALLVLGSVGTHSLARLLTTGMARWRPLALAGLQLLTVGVLARMDLPAERRTTAALREFSAYQEVDRAEAGRWVNEHTPPEFRVLTMWGNPAYFARRYVYDGSFLNRPYEAGDLLDRYRPEIAVVQGTPGSSPSRPEFPGLVDKGYEVVKIFDATHLAGMDNFFGVLARSDVADRVTDREAVVDLMRFVGTVELGDRLGLLTVRGRQLFVHPGQSTPTTFEVDAAAFLREARRDRGELAAAMAPNVPARAIARGAANVKVTVMRDGRVVAEGVVRAGRPLSAPLDGTGSGRYRVVVDNNGSPDTDWLLISLR